MADVNLVRKKIPLVMEDLHTDSMGVNPVVKETQTFGRAREVLQPRGIAGYWWVTRWSTLVRTIRKSPTAISVFGKKAPGWRTPLTRAAPERGGGRLRRPG